MLTDRVSTLLERCGSDVQDPPSDDQVRRGDTVLHGLLCPSPVHVSDPLTQVTGRSLAYIRAGDLHHGDTLAVQPSAGEEDQPLSDLRRTGELHGDVPAGEVVQRP